MTVYEPSLETESQEYKEFVDKFKPKKTTDDCYTPDKVYEAAKDWAVKEYELEGREIVRPFWPGGDYRSYDYPDGCVVIDNPPFSIMSKIVKFYNLHGVDYFLFAPHLTNFSIRDTNHIITDCSVIYENGADVSTSFVTNLGEYLISTPPDLFATVYEANRANLQETSPPKKSLSYEWPDELCTAAGIGDLAANGEYFTVKPEEAHRVNSLAEADAKGKGVFGGGFLLSQAKAQTKAQAKAQAKVRAEEKKGRPFKICLSAAEQEMVRILSERSDAL